MMPTNSSPGKLPVLQLLHRALLMGQFLFGAFAFYLIWSKTFSPPLENYNRLLQVIAIFLSFASFYFGTIIFFKKKVKVIKDSNWSVTTKLEKYRSASIIQWAMLEGAALFCTLCFLLVGNYSFLALSIALMGLFALMGVSKPKMMLLLNISEEEMKEI